MKDRAYSTRITRTKISRHSIILIELRITEEILEEEVSFIDKNSFKGDNLQDMLHVTGADNRGNFNMDAGCI